ncbi:DUF5626 family protein [Latilactobacillus curvatus]|uniref:DUF5626 family protein n=1 Tax=Latilactobacillus curvatus TaxID=28038 RepID=UPI0020C7578F|nr:DUF5626 family protein [Latilactobacillus curvatus]MCP8859480.1 DUF5626 family protein [Latilactobacillus curvatus]
MKKVAISFIILGGSFVLGSNLASANNEEVIYDLSNHQSIESFELEEDGNIVSVTIIDDSLLQNLDYKIIQPFRLADKTYTVSKNKKNSWSISYKVSVKNNQLTSAHSGSFKAAQGSFSNTTVTRHSNSSASAKGTWKHRAYASNLTVKATIRNNKLVVE